MSLTKWFSLSLCHIRLLGPRAFQNYSNLKTLKIMNITISQATVLIKVLETCSSLELIVLEVCTLVELHARCVLKIENNNLKFLQVTFHDKIDQFQVCSLSRCSWHQIYSILREIKTSSSMLLTSTLTETIALIVVFFTITWATSLLFFMYKVQTIA